MYFWVQKLWFICSVLHHRWNRILWHIHRDFIHTFWCPIHTKSGRLHLNPQLVNGQIQQFCCGPLTTKIPYFESRIDLQIMKAFHYLNHWKSFNECVGRFIWILEDVGMSPKVELTVKLVPDCSVLVVFWTLCGNYCTIMTRYSHNV